MLRTHHWLAGIVVALGGVLVSAQQLPQPRQVPTVQPPPANGDEDVEVLARGQLHEAFASSGEQPGPSPVIDKRPPDPVEELPPDQKPEGENVLWIPGYWDWDEDDKDFTWISGFWRNAPAGRVWVPGDWREVKSGWQWVPGFWNVAVPPQQQQAQPAQLEYLPPPPEVIESGPSVAAPSDDCFYTPGCWVYRVNRYVWRPGFWVRHRPDWVWVPDCYRWTPCGYVYVPGYWDCPLATRGVLFAPVRFRRAVFDRPRFVYTPAYVVPDTSLHTCLFVRTGRVNYYFGDYFEQRYVGLGYNSWCGTAVRGSNFAVTVGVTRTTYDPLWSYYSLTYRDTPAWQTNVTNVYVGRFKGDVPRPPRTLVQQNTVIQNVTNVTNVTNNNTTVVVNNPPAQAVIAPLADVSKVSSQPIAMAAVKADDRVQEQKQAKELRQFAAERRKVETAIVDKGQAVTKDDKPRQAKLEVPQAVAVRAQAPAKAENAPPPPAAPAKKPDPKTDPAPAAKPAVKPIAPPPVIDPKTGAVQQKKADDPKPTDPAKPAPKPADPVKPVDPVKPPVTTPPTNTKPVTPVPPVTTPKPVDPKPPVTPPVTTPVTPKPADPPKPPATTPKPVDPKPIAPPKVDPPKPPVTTPTTPAPKPVDLPKVDPKPKDPPKTVEPVKPPVVPVKPPVTTPTTPAPKPVDPPKADPPKTVAPPKVEAPKPVVLPPKPVDPPKPVVPPPKVEVPKTPPPAPVVNPAPKPVDPPKSVAPPPKPVEPPKPAAQPPKPTPPTKPKDEKKDKK
jgi:hypothetical protein